MVKIFLFHANKRRKLVLLDKYDLVSAYIFQASFFVHIYTNDENIHSQNQLMDIISKIPKSLIETPYCAIRELEYTSNAILLVVTNQPHPTICLKSSPLKALAVLHIYHLQK